MDYLIENELSITGIVNDTNENFILLKNEDGEYQVSLNVENKDSMTHFNIGDEVVSITTAILQRVIRCR